MESTVYVVDDDQELRASLRLVFESAGHRVREFADAESFLDEIDQLSDSPRCLVLDVNLQHTSGPELQNELARRELTIPIVMISGCADISIAVEAIQAGAVTFLQKPVTPEAICSSVERALELAGRDAEFRHRLTMLSSREREMLDFTLRERNPKQIAAELGISVKTVHKHRSHMLSKMGVRSDVELTNLAQSVNYAVDTSLESRMPQVNRS